MVQGEALEQVDPLPDGEAYLVAAEEYRVDPITARNTPQLMIAFIHLVRAISIPPRCYTITQSNTSNKHAMASSLGT